MFALDLLNQFQSYNGTLLAAGKIYVYHLGRTHLAPVYGDHNGATVLPNPVILDDQGMAEIYLNDAFNYTVVICDAYGAEQFSRDVYPKGMGNGESIGTQLYEGIDPIVVNNDVYAISANTSRLGVTEPLYFVRDDEEETIIGMSAIAVPSGTMNESAFSYQDDKITAYNGSAFSAGNEYEAGNYVSIDNNIISVTGLQPAGDYQSAGNYVSASELENLQPKGDYYSASNPSGFLIDEDITGKLDTTAFSTVSGNFLTAVPSEYVTEDTLQSGLSSKLDSTAFSTVSGNFLTAHQSLEGYATEQWVEDKGYITGVDIPQSADWNGATTVVNNNSAIWNNTTNVVSSNSAQWGATNPQIPVTSTSGISIFESGDKVYFNISADYAFNSDLQNISAEITGMIPAPFDPAYLSGQIDSKLNSAIYANDSGSFATTGDINDLVTSIAETYQPKLSFDYNEDSAISAINGSALAGGSYQPSGNYIPYTAIDGKAFKTNSGLKIATFIGSELRTNFINNNFITLQSVNSTLGINNQVILATGSLTLKTKSDSAYVDREKIHKWDSASDYIQNNSAALNEVSAKLDTTAFSTVSGDFYTTANESGFITGAPAGTMNESAFEYDTSNNITAYNGSAIGGITYTTGSI